MTVDDLATDVVNTAYGAGRAGADFEDLDEAFEGVPVEVAAFLKFHAQRFFESGRRVRPDLSVEVQRRAAGLVEEWIRYTAHHGRWPAFANVHAADIPSDTPRLDELARLMVDVLPFDVAIQMRSNLVPDQLRAADILIAGARALDDWGLAREAFRRADEHATGGFEWIAQNSTALVELDLPAPGRLGYGPAECIGWAAISGCGDVVDEVTSRFAAESSSVPLNGTGSTGTIAFARHITGSDGRGLAASFLESDYGWPGAGDAALALWVLAASETDPQRSLDHLALLLGFTLEPGVDCIDTNAVSIDVIANGRLDVTVGPLRHGRLPRLQARAWLDAAKALKALGQDHAHALDIAAQWYPLQDIAPEGHLWDPRIYHRFTDAIRVSEQDLQSLTA